MILQKNANINVVIGMSERNTESSNTILINSLLFIDNKGFIFGKHRMLIPTSNERLIWSQIDVAIYVLLILKPEK